MPNPDVAPSVPPSGGERRRQFTASLPMRTALLAVAAVWFLGAVWSYTEQSAFAAAKGFSFPHLLPLVIDGFAVAMAGVAWAASLDARPAVAARLATVVAVCGSSASNGAWAWIRTNHDVVAVLLGVTVPFAANLAFEVLLAELRRQVQRRRGLPPPVAVPYPRLIRLGLAPWRTFVEWRALVLELTAMEHTVATRPPAAGPGTAPAPTLPTPVAAPARVAGHPAPTVTAPTDTAPTVHAPVDPVAVPAPPPAPAVTLEAPAPAVAPAPAPTVPVERVPAEPAPVRREPAVEPVRTNGTARHTDDRHTEDRHTDSRHTNVQHTNARRTDRAARTGTNGSERRSADSRVEMLAAHLAATEDAGEFTGEMVGPLLGIEVAPRTGRRLLGQARELVAERARAEADRHDSGLRVIGAG